MASEKTALGEFEHHVLLATIRLGDDAYAASIVRELEERAEREVSAAAVYIALRRLEAHGLVESEMRSGTSDAGQRDRRYFTVTADGIELAREARRRLTRLWKGLAPLRLET
jgi:DNA-binding PadR family transcriptional regulator